jgi:uncharacterized protein
VIDKHSLRIRTITFGTTIDDLSQLDAIEHHVAGLKRARDRFNAEGYEVQTLRIALAPSPVNLTPSTRKAGLRTLQQMDALLVEHGVIMSLGPICSADIDDPDLAEWTTQLVRETQSISFSTVIASAEHGVHLHAVCTAARIMRALANALPGGLANFRFAAAANIPAGTPFFPVAWHRGPDSIAVGLEAAGLVQEAWASKPDLNSAQSVLASAFDRALKPIETIATDIATSESRAWLGIDSSPAPGMDRSIGAGIESLLDAPFGTASTLTACATLTAAIKSLSVKLCGYSGLMLPVLEDPVLARRASEERFTIRDLLLYSSVCGTGLDVVPIPGSTSLQTLTGLIGDVATLSTRLRKPLSVRLLLVPDKEAGDLASFDSPLLTPCRVMKLE